MVYKAANIRFQAIVFYQKARLEPIFTLAFIYIYGASDYQNHSTQLVDDYSSFLLVRFRSNND